MKNKKLMLELIDEKIEQLYKLNEKTNKHIKQLKDNIKMMQDRKLKEYAGTTIEDFKKHIEKRKSILVERNDKIKELENLKIEIMEG